MAYYGEGGEGEKKMRGFGSLVLSVWRWLLSENAALLPKTCSEPRLVSLTMVSRGGYL